VSSTCRHLVILNMASIMHLDNISNLNCLVVPSWRFMIFSDINDSESLTPSHLLYGRITSLAYLKIEIEESNIPVCMETSMLTKRAQILNTVLEHFWTRWKSEYLTSSREYHKTSGRNDQTNFQVSEWSNSAIQKMWRC
jgi:hypothetical protein